MVYYSLKGLKATVQRVCTLPVEITDLNLFADIARRAIECRIKRVRKGNLVKIKARTRRYLYTYKTTEDQLQDVLSKAQCKKVVDVDKEIKSEKT